MKLWIPIALALLTTPTLALASPTFPAKIQEEANMPCAPQCTLCHDDNNGGYTTANKPFAVAIYEVTDAAGDPVGLRGEEPETMKPALDALEAANTDTDNDGTSDVAELRDGQNPNIKGDSTLCGPLYGCGAHVAKSERTDWLAVVSALVASGALILSWRGRRSRKSIRSKRNSSSRY